MRRAAVVLALVAAGCAGPPDPESRPEVHLGVFTVGYVAVTPLDRELAQAAQQAAAEIGGAVSLEIVLPEEPGEPAEVARQLVLRGVQALVASCAPGAAHAVGEIATRTQVPAVAPCNDDPRIGVRYPYLWPVGLPANAEAAALADFAVARGYDSAAIVGGHAIARYAREALRDRKIPMGDSGAVTIAAAPAEAVLATPQRPLLGTHLLDTAAFASQPAAEGVVFTTYGFPDPGSAAAEFYAAFERRYGRRPSASAVALGYDAVRVLAAAIEAARSLDAGDIVNQLASGLFVDGALGRISYPGGGEHNPEVAVAVVRVETGRRVLVEKSLPEDVPSP